MTRPITQRILSEYINDNGYIYGGLFHNRSPLVEVGRVELVQLVHTLVVEVDSLKAEAARVPFPPPKSQLTDSQKQSIHADILCRGVDTFLCFKMKERVVGAQSGAAAAGQTYGLDNVLSVLDHAAKDVIEMMEDSV